MGVGNYWHHSFQMTSISILGEVGGGVGVIFDRVLQQLQQ